jgi:hypothetical protein
VPGFFTSSAERQIPPGSTVVTYPYAVFGDPTPMAWQAIDAMRYKLVGGEMLVPAQNGTATLDGTTSDIEELSRLAYLTGRKLKLTETDLSKLRSSLVTFDVGTVVVTNTAPGWAWMREVYREALGSPGESVEGTQVWFNVQLLVAEVSSSAS